MMDKLKSIDLTISDQQDDRYCDREKKNQWFHQRWIPK